MAAPAMPMVAAVLHSPRQTRALNMLCSSHRGVPCDGAPDAEQEAAFGARYTKPRASYAARREHGAESGRPGDLGSVPRTTTRRTPHMTRAGIPTRRNLGGSGSRLRVSAGFSPGFPCTTTLAYF